MSEIYKFYDTAEECAENAAPIFEEYRWRWARTGRKRPPTKEEILESLLELQKTADECGSNHCSSGRLIYEDGRFGHHNH